MVLKLVHSWKAAGAGPLASSDLSAATQVAVDLDNGDEDELLEYDDPEAIHARERKAGKQKHQKEAAAFDRELKQQRVSELQQLEDEDLRERDASAEYRHAMAALSVDMDDTRHSITWARERAAAEQQQARDDLGSAQSNALVVGGDRRVYFTRDGSLLYGEDDRQITDGTAIAAARNQQRARPDATTYEDYAEKKNAERQATEKVEQLRDSAAKLDELDKRIKKGHLSPEDLAQARKDQQDIVGALPAEAREEYARLQAARADERKLSYRTADPGFTSAPELSAEFLHAASKAAARPQTKEEDVSPPADRRAPVYKAAPDY